MYYILVMNLAALHMNSKIFCFKKMPLNGTVPTTIKQWNDTTGEPKTVTDMQNGNGLHQNNQGQGRYVTLY